MALSADIKTVRFGAPGNSTQPMNQPLTAAATVYRGSVATTRSGYLVAASSPQSTDVVWGLIDKAGAGTADTGPGITGGTTNGNVSVEIATGSFFLQNGTTSDPSTACLGSGCMAWRWVETHVSGPMKDDGAPGDLVPSSDTHGYCGLGGTGVSCPIGLMKTA